MRRHGFLSRLCCGGEAGAGAVALPAGHTDTAGAVAIQLWIEAKVGWPALSGVIPGGLPVAADVKKVGKPPFLLCRLKNSFLYSLDQNSARASLESLHKCHSCHSAEFFNNNTVMNRTVTNPYMFSGAKIENWQGNKCSFQTSEGALQAVGSKQQYYRLITMLLEDSFKVINMFLISLFPHFGSSGFACRYNFICRVWLWGCSWNIWGLYRWEGLDM